MILFKTLFLPVFLGVIVAIIFIKTDKTFTILNKEGDSDVL